jgi:hypothetical protein
MDAVGDSAVAAGEYTREKSADAWDATKETGAKVAESAGDTYGKVVDSLFGDSDSGAVVEDKSIE